MPFTQKNCLKKGKKMGEFHKTNDNSRAFLETIEAIKSAK
jgi:hypothetical protein